MPARLSGSRRHSRYAAGRSDCRLRVSGGTCTRDSYSCMPSKIKTNAGRLKRLIPRLRGKRIGVIGALMLDRYLWGTASRLSPEAAVPVVDFVEQSECLGGSGNVAANIAALGACVEAFGVVGSDEPGAALRNCLRASHIVDKGALAEPRRVTTVKTRIIARHQQVVRVDRE